MLLNFDFLVVLNLLVVVLWPATGRYNGPRADVPSIIMIVLSIIAFILDIVFLALKIIHG